MSNSAPEFSRTVRLDALGAAPHHMSVEAGEQECAKLAERFGLVAIASLSAEMDLVRKDAGVRASGRLVAQVTQSCVATGEPLQESVDEPFDILFVPEPVGREPDEEVELSEAECDTVFYSGSSIDVGEAVAESLSLALDPWPRSPEADSVLRGSGVKSEEEAGPFGVLAGLRDRMQDQ